MSGRRRARALPLLLLGLLVAHTASHPEASAEGAGIAGLQQIAVEAIGPVLAAPGPSSALGLSLDRGLLARPPPVVARA